MKTIYSFYKDDPDWKIADMVKDTNESLMNNPEAF